MRQAPRIDRVRVTLTTPGQKRQVEARRETLPFELPADCQQKKAEER